MSNPPSLLRRLAAALLPAADRAGMLAALDEDFEQRSSHRHFWYLAQTLHFAFVSRAPRPTRGSAMFWPTVVQDARFALRTLRRSPGFTAVAILSLAIGIGLNSTIFTLVDNLLFKPAPFHEPARLVSIYTSEGDRAPYGSSSFEDLRDLRSRTTVFEDVVGVSMMFAATSIRGDNRLVFGEIVTGNYFTALGVPMLAGAGFTPAHDVGEGNHPVAILSESLARRTFGGVSALGQIITIRNRPYTIVGIAPATYTGMAPGVIADLWVPVTMAGDVEPAGQIDTVPSASGTTRLTQRGNRWMFIKARLKPGVTGEAASASVTATMQALAAEYPISNKARGGTVLPMGSVRFHPDIDAMLEPAGLVLMGAVGLVLLVACANLASMLLARGTARTRELALRTALGANRGRLVRQMTVESLVLSTLGGAAGLVLAVWCTSWIVAARLPIDLPIRLTFSVDWRVISFTAALSLTTGLLFGLLPALRASRPDLVPALKDDASLAPVGHRFGLRHGLVIVQVAVSTVLIIGGLLLTRSAFSAIGTNPGFTPEGLVTATVSLDMHGYDETRSRQFFEQALARLEQSPGISAAAMAERVPFSPNTHTTTIVVDGHPERTGPQGDSVDTTRVTANFFETLGTPLVAGRLFDARDTPQSTRVAIINQAFAEKYFPEGNPVGRFVRLREQSGPLVEVVGVVRDYTVRRHGEGRLPVIHFASTQQVSTAASFLVRTAGDTDSAIRTVEQQLRALEPSLIFLEIGSVNRLINMTMLPITVGATLFSSLAGLAMLLAGVGLYGVIAFNVARRTREIGIRMALGSTRSDVVRRVMTEGAWMVGAGLVLGTALSALASQALASVLLGVTPFDPVSYLSAAGLLMATAALACLIPARRAASVDPLVALRSL